MAEIHPNDIGLATFADVGDVEKLKTSAKNLVDALNEIYQNGTQDGNFGEQMYVDGENNIILGENNIVYGSNNLIIGSDNIIVGDGVNIIAAGKSIYNEAEVSFDGYDAETRQVGYYPHADDAALPIKRGTYRNTANLKFGLESGARIYSEKGQSGMVGCRCSRKAHRIR